MFDKMFSSNYKFMVKKRFVNRSNSKQEMKMNSFHRVKCFMKWLIFLNGINNS